LNQPQNKLCDVISPAVAQCRAVGDGSTAKIYNNTRRRNNKKRDSIVIYWILPTGAQTMIEFRA